MEIATIFSKLLKSEQICTDKETLSEYGKDWLKLYEPKPSVVLFPSSTEEVAGIVRLAREHKIAIVPSGGRTGLSGGATAINGEAVISLDKMDKVIELNELDMSLKCQAGVPTDKIKQVAAEHQLSYPISFGSTGSSQIGGNIATNAGGIHVIRYGCTRSWVLGMTVVTGAGEILELNGSLYKDRSGYDLHQLIIGSEGTLAIVTEVVLRLKSQEKPLVTAFCGVTELSHALAILERTRREFPELNAFEYLERNGLEKVLSAKNIKDPFPDTYPVYLVIEFEETSTELRDKVEESLASLMEDETLAYVVLSQSSKQSRELMQLRELLPEVLASEAVLYKNDLALPISQLSSFLAELSEISKDFGGLEVVIFGHLGDGNIHLNVLKSESQTIDEFKAICRDKESEIFELVARHNGTLSAEHGIGLLKREHLGMRRSKEEITLMKGIKNVFDPDGILNPGKIFADT